MKKQELDCDSLEGVYVEMDLSRRELGVLHKALHLLDGSEPVLCDDCLKAIDMLHEMIVDALDHLEEYVEEAK